MAKIKNIIAIISFFLLGINCSFSQEASDFWELQSFSRDEDEAESKMNHYSLNKELLFSYLQAINSTSNIVQIPFPIGDNQIAFFEFKEQSILAESLQAKYPEIRSYVGIGVDNSALRIRLSWASNGLQATVFKSGQMIIIKPEDLTYENFIVYNKAENTDKTVEASCHFEDKEVDEINHLSFHRAEVDGNLRTYRLALACTGEYAQYHLNEQGVSPGASDAVKKAAVLSAMVTTITRVNGIFENELAVTLELVDNTDIIYLDGTTDPYTNGSPSTMLNENQVNLDSEVGNSNYDVGHVFGHIGGGIATFESVCDNAVKARGVTALTNPIGDTFDVDFVTHEFGHQFGATHTFNNSCGGERYNDTSVEPGSGSSIMGYAGTCSPNVQQNSNPYFHSVSLDQIKNFIENTATCSQNTPSGNSAPTITPIPDYSIPKNTPFVLRGNANDVDGNGTLTYAWDQTDSAPFVPAPPSDMATIGANFKSVIPTTSPDRYLPELGNPNEWEVLADVARAYNFDLIVRDNDPSGGRYTIESVVVNVIDVPAFGVTMPAKGSIWSTNPSQNIVWTVGQTDQAPINCSLVNIKLSTDGGLSYGTTLLSNTPNDGSQTVTIPDGVKGQTAYVMVEAVGNIFFGLSNDVALSTDEDEVAFIEDVIIYPNPAADELNILTNSSESMLISIYTSYGAKVFEQKTVDNKEVIDISQLSSGVYLVELKSNSSKIAHRLIIE